MEGVATCIMAGNYPLDAESLTEMQRLNLLQKTAEMNGNVKRNSMHISLNFAPEEQHSVALLKKIASEYMERIGFGNQPYLVYQHFDAGHPHIHIVTTKIRPDGNRIDTQNIGKGLSEPARKALEIKYDLVKADDHKAKLFRLKPINIRKLEYGKVSTKRAISNILAYVLDKYKYTSLRELNAVLKLYNVEAQQGQEGSRLRQFNGLLFRVIDSEGNGVGTPIKASAFAYEATLKDIEKRFLKADVQRQEHKPALRVAIDKALRDKKTANFPALIKLLKQSGIDLALHQNERGQLYGITFVDHRNHCVFKGSDLGKDYSAKAITERLADNLKEVRPEVFQGIAADHKPATEQISAGELPVTRSGINANNQYPTDKTLFEILLQPEYEPQTLPYQLRKSTRKKKKRKSIS